MDQHNGGTDVFLMEKLTHLNCDDRVKLAQSGQFLKELSKDNEPRVRTAVAQQGWFLDELKSDIDSRVRIAVAQSGFL